MSENSVAILLVEDNPAQARLLQEHLKSVRHTAFEWTSVSRLEGAIAALKASRFDVMLLDLTLPDSQGLESLDRIVAVAPELPVVVLTNADDDSLALDAVRLGAQDYLVKRHVNSQLLVKSLRYAIERKQASEALRRAKNDLEARVRERTLELARANEQLKREIRDRQGIEQALVHEKELAQVTLHSIGDAAISTDARGRVQSLNPVAETLTGWTSEAAWGQALETVLRLWDEVTRTPVENLLDRVLRDGACLDPLDHRLVGSNDTQEFCVELSAAPIRLNEGEIVGAVLSLSRRDPRAIAGPPTILASQPRSPHGIGQPPRVRASLGTGDRRRTPQRRKPRSLLSRPRSLQNRQRYLRSLRRRRTPASNQRVAAQQREKKRPAR